MRCHYFDAGVCRSCTLLGHGGESDGAGVDVGAGRYGSSGGCEDGALGGNGQRGRAGAPSENYARELAGKDAAVREILSGIADDAEWSAPFSSAEWGFRNKAKLVVGGAISAPTLGILGPQREGVDISECPLYEPQLAATFPVLREFIGRAGLTPFHVPSGRGELKNIIATISPAGGLMIRFVLRSTESLVRIRKHAGWLMEQLPGIEVLSVNFLPERKAVVEGDEEIIISSGEALRMDLGQVALYLRPQSFFQTNTAVAAGLYRTARDWVNEVGPTTLWDMFCGVGGFALHCGGVNGGPGAVHDGRMVGDERRLRLGGSGQRRRTIGVEISEQAVESARLSAREAGIDAEFIAGDAFAVARELGLPDLAIVNPPRRGIGQMAAWLNDSSIQAVLYSSCNPVSLAKDIASMPGFAVRKVQVFDMFPHTTHTETLCLLARR